MSGIFLAIYASPIFQFNHYQRQAIYKKQYIRALILIVFDDGVLIHHQKMIVSATNFLVDGG